MRTLALVGLALSLLSCVTLPSPSPMPPSVAEPVSFLNGLRVVREGVCNVTEDGYRKDLPCVVYRGPQGSSVVAVRNEKGILLWVSWIKSDGSQRVLWSRPRLTPISGVLVA